VTGGAGFIGSHLSRKLIENGWEVIVIDNLSTGFKENIPKEAEFIELDLSKDNFLRNLPAEGVDTIFHLAAQTSGEISYDDPVYDLKTNCLSTVLLSQWCIEKKVRKFVYTSSMSVYGDIADLPVSENIFPKPKSFYGIGKLASEHYLKVYGSKGLDYTALRLFNVYGPGQNLDNLRQGMVSIFMSFVAHNKEITVKGSRDRFRDFVYIDDVINALIAVVNDPKASGEIYNIGTGKKTTVEELLENIIEAFGHEIKTYPINYTKGTPGDQFGIYSDSSKINKKLGWGSKIELKEGIYKMADWAKKKLNDKNNFEEKNYDII